MENGPGAGPRPHASGKDDLALMLLELAGSFGDTFHQDGRCVYADDRVSISLIHETGTAPSGDRFDNLAVYVGRLRPDGTTERLWTVDLDAEHCEAFWQKTQLHPRRTFLSSSGPVLGRVLTRSSIAGVTEPGHPGAQCAMPEA